MSYEMPLPPDHMLKACAGGARGREILGGEEMKEGKQAKSCLGLGFFQLL